MSDLQFSTSTVPVSFRREMAEAAYVRYISGTVDFQKGTAFEADLKVRPLADVQLARLNVSPVKFSTSANDRELLYIGITLEGGGRLVERGRDALELKAGDISIKRCDRNYDSLADLHSDFLYIAIPYDRIMPCLTDGDRIDRVFSAQLPAAQLLTNYATILLNTETALSNPEQALSASHIADLASLMLGANRDAHDHAQRNGARAARWQAIQADIHANLGNPALSVEWLARRNGLSPSYTRTLFYGEGTNFTDFVATARLDGMALRLRDPANAHRTITALAMETGFGDISWFNQLFRRRFGMTPSEMRAGEEGRV